MTDSIPYFVDIHCHPTFMPYNRSRIEQTTIKEFWPEAAPEDTVDEQRIKPSPTLLQSDFTTLSRSKVRVCFASLLALEQGFIWRQNQLSNIQNIIDQLYSDFKNKMPWLQVFIIRIIAMVASKSSMKIPWLRSFRVQSASHDYFEDLKKEFQLLTTEDNWQCPAEILSTTPTAKVVSNYQELEQTLVEPYNTTAVIITVEGGHALGSGSVYWCNKVGDDDHPLDNTTDVPIQNFQLDDTIFDNQIQDPSLDDPSLGNMVNRFRSAEVRELVRTLLANIWKMKHWGNSYEGQFAPFFITFSHHFWNQLCGHAISLPRMDIIKKISKGKHESPPDLMVELWNQDTGLEVPMTEVGKVVVCALLSIKNGRRMLIDAKHMSQSGKNWYYGCVESFNETLTDDKKIPIISSHSAGNENPAMPTTSDETAGDANRNYEDDNNIARFNIWNINLSDVEIWRIHKSNGLIGLNFDERILAGKPWRKKLHSDDVDPNSGDVVPKSAEWVKPIAEHLYHVAWVIATKEELPSNPTWGEQEAKKVWRRLAMGSDFDGAIDPVDAYCRAIDFTELESQLTERLAHMRNGVDIDVEYGLSDYPLLDGLDDSNIAQIVDCFMRGNAMGFLETYFNDTYRCE
jgi:hypothetical protein